MIRDGLDSTIKIIRRKPAYVSTHEYASVYMGAVANAVKMITNFDDYSGVQYINDPYGLSLIFEPIGAKVDEYNGPRDSSITAEEYYTALINDTFDEILPRLTSEERIYADEADKLEIDMWRCIETYCHGNSIDIAETRDVYVLQPDADAIAFGLASKRAVLEGLSPVVGLPLKMVYPTTTTWSIRFPIALEDNLYIKGELVHVHRSPDMFRAFDKFGKQIEFPVDVNVALSDLPFSFVIEGFIIDNTDFKVTDILCLNDIWLHRRPLIERLQFLWRFPEYTQERLIIHSYSELNDFPGEFVLRNLNAPYNPGSVTSHIAISGRVQTGILKVGGRKGGVAGPHLITKDGRAVFQIDTKIDKEDWNDLVEVTKDGKIIKILPKNIIPDSWVEISDKWNLNDYEKYTEYRIPVVQWLGKSS